VRDRGVEWEGGKEGRGEGRMERDGGGGREGERGRGE